MAGLASIATFGLRFVAKDQASDVLKSLGQKYAFFNRVTGRGFDEVSAKIQENGLAQKLALGTAGLAVYQLAQMTQRAARITVNAFRSIMKAAASFEEQMVTFGVIANRTGDSLDSLKQRILEVTGPLPTSANQVAKAATAFARMGLAAESSAENLIDLSNEAIMFGRAIGVTDEKAALFMGKLATWLNIQNKTAESMGRVASVVTRLGWRIKGTSQDIIKATERFGAFVRAMGATEVETLSLAALVVDSGILIRRGSTAINRSFQLMATNTRQFGRAMAQMGEVGSAVEFERIFRTKPVKAFEIVLKALSKQGGAYGATMLKSLGLHGNYISDLITMSRNVGKLSTLQAEGTDEQEKAAKGIGATRKAFEAYKTTMNASLKILKGAWENIKIVMGSPLLGFFAEVFTAISDLMTATIKWAPWLLKTIGLLLALAAAALTVLAVIIAVSLAMFALKLAGLATMAAWLKGIVIVIAAIVALVAILTLALWVWNKLTGKGKTMKDTFKDVTGGIRDVSSEVVASAAGGLSTPAQGTFGGQPQLAMGGGGQGFAQTPQISLPGAARGGIVNRPTPLIAGEAGAEAIAPLDTLTRSWNTSMRMLADELGDRIETAMSSGEPPKIEITVPVTLDGEVISKNVTEAAEVEGLRKGESS